VPIGRCRRFGEGPLAAFRAFLPPPLPALSGALNMQTAVASRSLVYWEQSVVDSRAQGRAWQ